MNLFGKKKKVDISKTISNLNEMVETLQKKEAFFENKIALFKQQALSFVKSGNKRSALASLKRKRMYERECEKLLGIRMNVETQMFAITQAVTNSDTVNVLKQGNLALQELQKTSSVDETEDVMSSIEETIADNNEVTEILSRPVNPLDEDELEAELAELLHTSVPTVVKPEQFVLPNAPTTPIPSKEEQEFEELRKIMNSS